MAGLLLTSTLAVSQFQGPVPAISSGYGAPGSDSVAVEVVTNSHWQQNPLVVFHPAGRSAPVPTIFYAHPYGGNDTLYQIEMLRHIASRGYAAVFVPYRTFGVSVPERYATLLDGFHDAVRAHPQIFDTTRIGFFGHSFGGGASPYLAHQLIVGDGWGGRGRFVYMSAPWYSFQLGDSILPNFPSHCPLLVTLYDDDRINDHRLGMDIFRNIAIPDSLKDLVVVHSDTIDGYTYPADHNLPSQYSPGAGKYDALDSRVVFRLLDALADYAFEDSPLGRRVALGGGDSAQVVLGGGLAPLEESEAPTAIHPKERYEFPCDTIYNPRQTFCGTSVSALGNLVGSHSARIEVSSRDRIEVKGTGSGGLILRRPSGQILSHSTNAEVSVAGLPAGLYLVQIPDGPTLRYLRPSP